LSSHGMRDMRVESLTGESFSRYCLLLRVDPFAGLVLRAHQDRGRRPHRSNAITGYGAVAPQHENIIAQHLVVVLRKVARLAAFVVTIGHLAVGLHREVTTETAGDP